MSVKSSTLHFWTPTIWVKATPIQFRSVSGWYGFSHSEDRFIEVQRLSREPEFEMQRQKRKASLSSAPFFAPLSLCYKKRCCWSIWRRRIAQKTSEIQFYHLSAERSLINLAEKFGFSLALREPGGQGWCRSSVWPDWLAVKSSAVQIGGRQDSTARAWLGNLQLGGSELRL